MQVRIYRPTKSAMQSGRANTNHWLVEFEPRAPKEIDPLMGWISSRDTTNQVRLKFRTKDEAIAYATRQGYDYVIVEDRGARAFRPKNYADNFRYDRVV